MSAKDELRSLVEELSERDAEDALPLLEVWRTDRMRAVLDAAPEVDEPLNDEEEHGWRESRAERRRGETLTHDELLRELGS